MSGEFTLEVQTRTDLGKGASRRLRRLENKVLGIIYGNNIDPQAISIRDNEIAKLAQSEAFFTSLITLSVDGKNEKVVIKDLQRHPAKETIMHADFLRISDTTKITMTIPLHFINEEACPGVKLQGGVASHAVSDIEISCLPANLPEFIEVDMIELNAGENVHISDLKLPEGVESVALIHGADHDLLISAVNIPRGSDTDDEEDEAATATEDGAEEGDAE
ncbi:MAG: 50S ribosomal protein L25/general stress protein Ctc [Spongiibacteraceae bacterium]|nr:50S ribosomal protein L25/general stress protein Ctc [Spongiibacteraceae bacterium]